MDAADIVALVDFRYVEDALTADEALALLRGREAGRAEREAHLLAEGCPAYTSSAGWLGYDDDKMRRLLREAVDAGFDQLKLKVGADPDDDLRRCTIARETIGDDRRLMIDANQAWGVHEAIESVLRLAHLDIGWIEEPTSPDDVLGHAAIARALPAIPVATGEHVHNRVMFKQLMQAGGMGVCQIDACRLGGVNEVVAVLLMAAKFGIPVCPHAGGVGLCELVQHIAAFDYVAVSGTFDGRVVEYVDHLHEHFLDPCVIERGRYRAPTAPGYSTEIRRESLERYGFPHGEVWAPQMA
jgi:L-fuconate dehydratase